MDVRREVTDSVEEKPASGAQLASRGLIKRPQRGRRLLAVRDQFPRRNRKRSRQIHRAVREAKRKQAIRPVEILDIVVDLSGRFLLLDQKPVKGNAEVSTGAAATNDRRTREKRPSVPISRSTPLISLASCVALSRSSIMRGPSCAELA